MGLRDRDYMKGDDGEGRGRRYDDEARQAEYGDFRAKRQAQFRRTVIIFLIGIVVLFVIAFLTSKK
jgi:hypothetical protein